MYASQTAAAEQGSGDNGGNGGPGDVTSTRHLTSTFTNYITAYASASSAAANADEKIAQGTDNGGNGGCAAASTVTVQGPEVTVTVVSSYSWLISSIYQCSLPRHTP